MSAAPNAPDAPRLAGIAEIAGIVGLVQSAYRGPTSREGWTTEADLLGGRRTDPAMVRDLLVSTDDAILVRGPRDEPAACCAVGQRDERVSLGLFAVRPALQGSGIGGGLLRAAERYAVDRWAADALELTVIAQRPELIAWYERRGYVRTGDTEPFPYGDPRYGDPRRADLVLLVLRRRLG